jgi:CDK inhibitor PHO81
MLFGPQINSFYLLKEGELKLRLATLLSKRKAAAKRSGTQNLSESSVGEASGVEWRAVHEAFRLLERDLSKLQVKMLLATRSAVLTVRE